MFDIDKIVLEIPTLNLDKTDLKNDTLIILNDDDSVTCIPREGATDNELELFAQFEKVYPDGKPVPTVEPQTPVPTDSDRIKALESALSVLMGV